MPKLQMLPDPSKCPLGSRVSRGTFSFFFFLLPLLHAIAVLPPSPSPARHCCSSSLSRTPLLFYSATSSFSSFDKIKAYFLLCYLGASGVPFSMAEEGFKVLLNVYDLSQGLAKQLSNSFLGKVIEGIWHTGVAVYGKEYYFGGGVQSCPQGLTPYGRPLRVVELGYTQIPKEMFEDYLQEIKPRYSEQTYNLLHHNCNNFSEEIAQFLLGESIPDYILKLPEEVMNSPMGALIMPMIQQLETTLRYGGVPQVPHANGGEVPKLSKMPAANFPASNVRMNGSSQELPSSSSAAVCNDATSTASKSATGKLPEIKVDALGEARSQVQQEITNEFTALMAEGRLRASEAAAVATRRVMERHGRGVGLASES